MEKLLIIGYVWPEPSTTAAGHRMLQLIHTFTTFGYQITFGSTATETDFSENLESLGVTCVSLKLNHGSFDELLKQLNPKVVLFDRFMVEEQFGWRVAEVLPNTLRVLNTEDLHSLRKAREEAFKKETEFTTDQWLQTDMVKREVASIYRSDLTLMISTYEMELLTERLQVPSDILLYLPFQFDAIKDAAKNDWPDFKSRKDFISFGNGKHAPNVDSIKYLKQTIWPLIRKALPNASLNIYGAYLPQQIEEMHAPNEGFMVHGWVENLDAELQNSRVCLAPLRFGAGIKGKLTDAMKNGTPSVTTSIGVEGMHSEFPWGGVVEDNPKDFAKKAISLYQDFQKWQQAQSRGIEIFNVQYPRKTLQEIFRQRVEKIQSNLKNHRAQNFVGQLLQHHTAASTKFMGKWIEEKNKHS